MPTFTKKIDGILMRHQGGQARYLTFCEGVLYRLGKRGFAPSWPI